jgi:hypothetical protein
VLAQGVLAVMEVDFGSGRCRPELGQREAATADLALPRHGVDAIEQSALVGPRPLDRHCVVGDGSGRPDSAAPQLSCERGPWPEEAARVESESSPTVDVMVASPGRCSRASHWL